MFESDDDDDDDGRHTRESESRRSRRVACEGVSMRSTIPPVVDGGASAAALSSSSSSSRRETEFLLPREEDGVKSSSQSRRRLAIVAVIVAVIMCACACVSPRVGDGTVWARGASALGDGSSSSSSGGGDDGGVVHLAYSVCGRERNREALLAVKSAVSMMSSDTKYKIHVFTDNERSKNAVIGIKNRLGLPNVEFASYHVDSREPLQRLFSLCSPNRLLIPAKLAEVGVHKYIYLDTDTLWREDPKIAYGLLDTFAPEQVVGFTQEHESGETGWYNEHASNKIHYPPPNGLNAGIMFVNGGGQALTDDFRQVAHAFRSPKAVFRLGDQDIINHYLSTRPEKWFRLPCKYNRRTDSYCEGDVSGGIMHGNHGVFHLQPGQRNYNEEYVRAWNSNDRLDLRSKFSQDSS